MTHTGLVDIQGEPIETGMRIGLYGGTFDPVHIGHIKAAVHVSEALSLDSLIFIPAMHPPHKRKHAITPFKDRVAMLQIAAEGQPGFFISAMEAERTGLSYTVDTLTEVRTHLDKGCELFFIVGLDMFIEINTWKDFKKIPELSDLIIIPRPTHNQDLMETTINKHFSTYLFGDEN